MGAILAIILLNASIIGACTVSLSISYAFGDTFGTQHSLHSRLSEAKLFYGTYAAAVVLAGAIVLIPGAPLGLLTLAVQALAGILLPSATVFLLLLCNELAVLGPRVNALWLNAVTTVIVGLLVILSLILMTVTIFPNIDAIRLVAVLSILFIVSFVIMGLIALLRYQGRRPDEERVRSSHKEKETWQMPPLEDLPKPVWSVTRTIGLFILRAYLVIAVILMVVKVFQLALRH